MNRESIVFCVVAIAVSLGAATLGFRIAALPAASTAAARTPVPAESLGEVDLGGAWGKVSVLELVGFYVENPPAPKSAAGASVPAAKRFGGC